MRRPRRPQRAGKSTLIKMMLGLIRPSAGSVKVLGEDPAVGAALGRGANSAISLKMSRCIRR